MWAPDGLSLMGEKVKSKLRRCGEGVKIHPLAKVCKPEAVSLGDHCTLGDFVFIWGGQETTIGPHSHIQVHCKIWGGGRTIIGSYVSVGLGSTLLSAVYDYKLGLRMVDHLPEGHTNTLFGTLQIGDDAYIGADCTILPVKIGEGAVVGARSVVNKDLDPWGVYVGSPAKKVGERNPEIINQLREGVWQCIS